jgi:hypothetical protein
MIPTILDINEENFLLTLKSSGKSKSVEDYNVYDEYLNRFNEKPSCFKIYSEDIDFYEVDKIRKFIRKEFQKSEILFSDNYYSLKYKKNISKKEIWLIDDGYILSLSIDIASSFILNPETEVGLDKMTEITDFNSIVIPNQSSKYYNKEIIDKLIYIFNDSSIKEEEKSSIGMVAVDNGELYVKEFNLNQKFKLKNMDLHYGDGFTEFDKKLINKLKKDKKGLILLHGNPGTGKTFYIRHLLSKITQNDKSILYFPPSMVSTITDPSFVNFINDWVNENEKSCIILIEDAEPLLISRDDDFSGNNGITNLLNLTDGLLNDIFGIQIIATFNTHLDNLDKALLRSERLIARKEFRPLNKEKALILANKLKIDKNKIKDDMTLADIYAIKKKNEILLHDIDEPKKSVGFKLK